MSRRASVFARQNPGRRRVRFPDEIVFEDCIKESDGELIMGMLRRASIDIDVDRINMAGMTALHQAVLDNSLVVVKILLQHGASIDKADLDSWTPLHAAAANGHPQIVRYLVSQGANKDALTDEGERPIDLVDQEDKETLKILLETEAVEERDRRLSLALERGAGSEPPLWFRRESIKFGEDLRRESFNAIRARKGSMWNSEVVDEEEEEDEDSQEDTNSEHEDGQSESLIHKIDSRLKGTGSISAITQRLESSASSGGKSALKSSHSSSSWSSGSASLPKSALKSSVSVPSSTLTSKSPAGSLSTSPSSSLLASALNNASSRLSHLSSSASSSVTKSDAAKVLRDWRSSEREDTRDKTTEAKHKVASLSPRLKRNVDNWPPASSATDSSSVTKVGNSSAWPPSSPTIAKPSLIVSASDKISYNRPTSVTNKLSRESNVRPIEKTTSHMSLEDTSYRKRSTDARESKPGGSNRMPTVVRPAFKVAVSTPYEYSSNGSRPISVVSDAPLPSTLNRLSLGTSTGSKVKFEADSAYKSSLTSCKESEWKPTTEKARPEVTPVNTKSDTTSSVRVTSIATKSELSFPKTTLSSSASSSPNRLTSRSAESPSRGIGNRLRAPGTVTCNSSPSRSPTRPTLSPSSSRGTSPSSQRTRQLIQRLGGTSTPKKEHQELIKTSPTDDPTRSWSSRSGSSTASRSSDTPSSPKLSGGTGRLFGKIDKMTDKIKTPVDERFGGSKVKSVTMAAGDDEIENLLDAWKKKRTEKKER